MPAANDGLPAAAAPNGFALAAGLSGAVCIVTGGLGFIGSNLVHALVGGGATVRVIDALVPTHGGDERNLEGLREPAAVAGRTTTDVLISDIGETERVAADSIADRLRDADVVFNLAGQVSHTASMTDPEHDLNVNVISHLRFLDTVRRVRPGARVVHASTRQVYGRTDGGLVDESHPARPTDVNGVAKLAGEQLHSVYHSAHGMATTSLRLTNCYGPRQCLRRNDLGVLPVFIRLALSGQPLRIFGDGEQRRDCLHVTDVVAAFVAAALNDGTVASPRPSVEVVPFPDDHRRIDIGSIHTSSARFQAATGWRATMPFRDGVVDTLDFYRANDWYLS
jgi:UDP-glucose 4-epimerase